MTKPLLAYNPIMQYLNTDGTVLAGGTITIYQAGTTTLLNTYPTATDATNSTNVNPNPITLDSAGRPSNSNLPIDLYITQSWKLVVKDSNGTTIRTVDNIAPTSQIIQSSSKATNYTVLVTDRDKIFITDTTTGSVTYTLPAVASAGDGFKVEFKKMDNSNNSMIIQGNSSETIDGSNTMTLTKSYDYVCMVCNGSQWIAEKYWQVAGPASKTADYTVTVADDGKTFVVSPSSANITISLPAISTVRSGYDITIKKGNTSQYQVIVAANGVDTIDGSTSYTMINSYDHIKLQSTGSVWIKDERVVEVSTQSKSADYTVIATDNKSILLVDSTGANRTITLPTASVVGNGFKVAIKKYDSSSNTVTVTRASSDTIDGATSFTLSQPYDYLSLICTGSGWTKENHKNFTNNVSLSSAASIVQDGVTLGQLFYKEITVAYSDLASGASKTAVSSSGVQQYKIREIWRAQQNGTNYSGGGGDRNIILTDNTTTFFSGSTSLIQNYTSDWADYGINRHTSSVAGTNVVFKYSGGTTDYTAGSIIFILCVEKVA